MDTPLRFEPKVRPCETCVKPPTRHRWEEMAHMTGRFCIPIRLSVVMKVLKCYASLCKDGGVLFDA